MKGLGGNGVGVAAERREFGGKGVASPPWFFVFNLYHLLQSRLDRWLGILEVRMEPFPPHTMIVKDGGRQIMALLKKSLRRP